MTVELSQDDLVRSRIIGFDLAGAEEPGKIYRIASTIFTTTQRVFAHNDCAGETLPVESIWNAVYRLLIE